MEAKLTDRILLAHGSGGKVARDLIEKNFVSVFDNPLLSAMEDSAVLEVEGKIAFTTDSFVVNPIFFPGGDIGKLAVCGTVNDLAMAGAVPKYLSLSFIIEEGLEIEVLDRIVKYMALTGKEEKEKIEKGDKKDEKRGDAERKINKKKGVGNKTDGVKNASGSAKPGEKLIINGEIGDNGIAVF